MPRTKSNRKHVYKPRLVKIPRFDRLPEPTWQDKEYGVSLYCGDCVDVLPLLPNECLIITDPPYGVGFRNSEWDNEIPRIAKELPNMFNRAAIIIGTTAAWQFPIPKWVACWARPASSSRSKVGGFSHWSPILLYGDVKMPVDFKSWHAIANAHKHGFEHPSPKPICLMDWLVSTLSCKTDTILDPFMGSGTTGVACVNLGRSFIGIELEPKYFDISVERIQRAIKHKKMELLPVEEVKLSTRYLLKGK